MTRISNHIHQVSLSLRDIIYVIKCVKKGKMLATFYYILRFLLISIRFPMLELIEDIFARIYKVFMVEVYGLKQLAYDLEGVQILLPSFEQEILSFILRQIAIRKRNNRELYAVNIGAHIGKYSVILARLGINVVAVEPNPLNFLFLQKI